MSFLRFAVTSLFYFAISCVAAEESVLHTDAPSSGESPWHCGDAASPIMENALTATSELPKNNKTPADDETSWNKTSYSLRSATLPSTSATASSVPFPLAGSVSHRKSRFDWSSCADSNTLQLDPITNLPLDRSSPIDIRSDHATVYEQDTAVLWGHVRLTHPGESLETPWLLYDLSLDTAEAQYGLLYRRGGLTVEGREGLFDLEYGRGSMDDARYYLPSAHARGAAATAQMADRTHSHYTDATYSTCVPGHEDWVLHADSLDLDQTNNLGIGRGVTTYFKGVPLFYTPYFSFPISDKRESGLLTPTIGSSSRSGLDLRLPYYWNIAPDHDATFTARYLSRRGMQLDGEFRYLTPHSNGQVVIEYLPNDQLTKKDRGLFSFQHLSDLSPRTHADFLYNAVSDQDYFHDLGNSIALTSISYLERHAEITYAGDNWSGFGRVQGFQTLDGSRPFERMPQFQFTLDPLNGRWDTDSRMIGEVSNFYRPSIVGGTNTNQNYTGTRLWLQPSIAYPVTGLKGFFTPRLTLHHVDYALTDIAPGLASNPSVTVPVFSADAGLFLERNFSFGNQKLIQTLEPRIYYLYVPYKNQQNLPIFDTTLLDFNMGQLFRENRFSGPDRIGDANQLAMAVTSRFLDGSNGVQLLYGSLGQVIYFKDRLVSLGYGAPTATVATTNDGSSTSRSDTVAEVGARLGRYWTASSTVEWSQQQGQPEQRFLRLRYQSDRDHIVNFALNERRDLLDQTDISLVWPIARQWRAVARWNYSLKDSQTMESFVGVRYEKCCWAMQVVARRYVDLPNAAPVSNVMLQFELKGLASIGEKLDPLLTNSILGYESVNRADPRFPNSAP